MYTKSTKENSEVDLAELLAMVEGDRDFLREVLEIFRQEFPPLCVSLSEAVSCGNLDQVRIAAHTMTGMLANLSFTTATDSAMRIGRMARENKPEDIPQEFARMERCVTAAQAQLAMIWEEAIY